MITFTTTQDLRAYLMPLIEEWNVLEVPASVFDDLCDIQEAEALDMGLPAAPLLVKLLQEEWAADSDYCVELSIFCEHYAEMFEADEEVPPASIANKDLATLRTVLNELNVIMDQAAL
jgi:hypothetical protein